MSVDRFDQTRKEQATQCEAQVRECLEAHYDAAPNQVVSAEHGREGAYETEGNYQPTDLLDYAGIDWLVDDVPVIVGVGERIRPNEEGRRDFSWRLDNGCARPCESDRIPAGLDRGIAPSTLLFGWRSGATLDRAWLLDCQALVDGLRAAALSPDERPTGDGTRAAYIPIGDLVTAGCVVDSWSFGGDD